MDNKKILFLLMKKLMLCVLIATLLLQTAAAVYINEVEINPDGGRAGVEWIELFNGDSQTDISNWEVWDGLSSSKKRAVVPAGTVIQQNGYFIVKFSGAVLNNNGDFIILYDSNLNKIDETEILKDASGGGKTWQLCREWEFKDSTKAGKNTCEQTPENFPEQTSEFVQENNSEAVEPQTSEELESNDDNNFQPQKNSLVVEPIILTAVKTTLPKDIKSSISSKNLDNNYTLYGFAGFCILLGFLFLFKNKKEYRSEFK